MNTRPIKNEPQHTTVIVKPKKNLRKIALFTILLSLVTPLILAVIIDDKSDLPTQRGIFTTEYCTDYTTAAKHKKYINFSCTGTFATTDNTSPIVPPPVKLSFSVQPNESINTEKIDVLLRSDGAITLAKHGFVDSNIYTGGIFLSMLAFVVGLVFLVVSLTKRYKNSTFVGVSDVAAKEVSKKNMALSKKAIAITSVITLLLLLAYVMISKDTDIDATHRFTTESCSSTTESELSCKGTLVPLPNLNKVQPLEHSLIVSADKPLTINEDVLLSLDESNSFTLVHDTTSTLGILKYLLFLSGTTTVVLVIVYIVADRNPNSRKNKSGYVG